MIEVHADYYAQFQQNHGKRKFGRWIYSRLCDWTYNDWAIMHMIKLGYDRFVGWKPYCGSRAMKWTSIAYPAQIWADIDSKLPGRWFTFFVNEMLEDDALSPGRRAEKLAYWRNGGKKVKPLQKENSDCQRCKNVDDTELKYSNLVESAKVLVDYVQDLVREKKAEFPPGTVVGHMHNILELYKQHLSRQHR